MTKLLSPDTPLLVYVLQWALTLSYLTTTIYSFIYFSKLACSNRTYLTVLRSIAIVPIIILERALNYSSLPYPVYLTILFILFILSSYIAFSTIVDFQVVEKVLNENLMNTIKLKQFDKSSFEGLLLINLDKEGISYNLIDCNNVVLELTQFTKSQVTNNLDLLFSLEDIKKIKQSIEARSTAPILVKLKTSKGESIPTELYFHYFNNPSHYLVLSIIDITDKVNLNNLLSIFNTIIEDQFLDLEQLNNKINAKANTKTTTIRSKDIVPDLKDDINLFKNYLDQSYILEILDYIIKNNSGLSDR